MDETLTVEVGLPDRGSVGDEAKAKAVASTLGRVAAGAAAKGGGIRLLIAVRTRGGVEVLIDPGTSPVRDDAATRKAFAAIPGVIGFRQNVAHKGLGG